MLFCLCMFVFSFRPFSTRPISDRMPVAVQRIGPVPMVKQMGYCVGDYTVNLCYTLARQLYNINLVYALQTTRLTYRSPSLVLTPNAGAISSSLLYCLSTITTKPETGVC